MTISVVITFYNKGYLLIDAISSVYDQIEPGDEIVVINDCSTEAASKSALLQAKKHFNKSIFFYDTVKNSGASYAKNFGIELSTTEIIVLLDADDQLPENSIVKIKNKFRETKEAGLVFGNYVRNNVEENQKKIVNCFDITEHGYLCPYKLVNNWKLLGSSPFRKEIYKMIGGFDNLYPKTDDIDFHRRLIIKNIKCAYLDEIIYIWNKYPDGNNSNHQHEDKLYSRMRGLEFFIQNLSFFGLLKFLIKNFILVFIVRLKLKK